MFKENLEYSPQEVIILDQSLALGLFTISGFFFFFMSSDLYHYPKQPHEML